MYDKLQKRVLRWLFRVASIALPTLTYADEIRSESLTQKLNLLAEAYILEKYPESTDVLSLDVKIIDRGEYWVVTYILPELSIGGVPEVYIRKDSLMVEKAYHTQ